MRAVLQTRIKGLPEPKRGKVREVYDLGEDLLIVSTDRISAFDVVMSNGVPGKGVVLNQISKFWFELLADPQHHHVISTNDALVAQRIGVEMRELRGRCMVARRAQPLAVECVARGYIAGSLYKEYVSQGGKIHGLDLPDGLKDGSKLPEPIFSPATKAEEGHDQNISFNQAVDMLGADVAKKVRDWTLDLYSRAAEHADKAGLILADTKFEFGLVDGEIIWIDEALSPDSSRFWEKSLWKPGGAQASFDKQYVRDYLETIGWDKKPPGPTLPEEVLSGTRDRYFEAYRRITGRDVFLS